MNEVIVPITHFWQGHISDIAPSAGRYACMFASWCEALQVKEPLALWRAATAPIGKPCGSGCGTDAGIVCAKCAWINSHEALIGLTGRPAKMRIVDVYPNTTEAIAVIDNELANGRAIHCRVSGHSMCLYGSREYETGKYYLIDDVGRNNPEDGDTFAGPVDAEHGKIIEYADGKDTDRGWQMWHGYSYSIRGGRPLWRVYIAG